jgi:hypothetical protein
MYADNLLTLSGSISTAGVVSGQTVTGASSVLSTNTIDLASGGTPSSQTRDIGAGSDFELMRVQVMTAFTGLTALECQVITADDAALTTNVTVIGSSGAVPVASLVANARFAVQINPRIASKGQRYIGARYVPTGTGTAGAVFADIGPDYQDGQKFYPVGFSVQ